MHKDLKDLSVLVVDDDRHLRTIVRAILSALPGVTLREAESAVAGWELICRYEHTLIIVDWNMPRINGLQFIRRVRQSPRSPDRCVPIVLMTAHTNPDVIARARDAGANQVLAKPVSAKALLGKISAALNSDCAFIEAKSYVGPDRRRREAPYHSPNRRVATK